MLRDRAAAAAIVMWVVAAGCSFEVAATTSDGGGGDDAPAPPTIGFAQPSSTQDESSGLVMITVELSAPAIGPVSVDVAFGGDATQGIDYTTTTSTLSFAPGEMTKTIDLTIVADGVPETEETIAITLSSPTGAVLGAASSHTVSIAATPLPRVVLSTSTSMADEAQNVSIVLMLDMPAPGPLTVDFTVGGGTAQPSGTFADFTLASGQVMFAQGDMMKTLPLGVINDARNELGETLNITLTTSNGVVIGATAVQQHTIVDNDPVPSVRFSQASSSITEGDTGTTQAMISVTLTAASGRTVVVPYALNTGLTTANDPADYTLTGTTLTFAEGVTTQVIVVNVVGDTVNEPDEEVHLVLSSAADGSAIAAGQVTRRLIINDNDPWCQGSGVYRVCYSTAPTAAVALPTTLDTSSSGSSGGLCESTQPTGWTGAQGQPTVCVIRGTSINVTATSVTGTRPLVLAATNAITINTLDVASQRGVKLGPASPSTAAQCSLFLQAPGTGGGGAGGSFMSLGGDGGLGNGGSPQGRAANQLATAPTALRAGCHGQQGEGGDETGKGGGVVYIAAGGTLTITGGINASGSAGTGGTSRSGGSGGGSGGMIVLYAASMSVAGSVIMANGGGGAGGGDQNSGGNNGNDPVLNAPTMPALGGLLVSAGGAGFAGPSQATSGVGLGAQNLGGGGGGGGGGYVKSNLMPTSANVSAGRLDVP